MADSFAAAFSQVDGPRLDLLRGYIVLPRRHAPTDPGIRVAFKGFDYERDFGGIVRTLARRLRGHEAEAEDATHGAFEELLWKHPERLREDPTTWLGWLYSVAYRRLLRTYLIRLAPRGPRALA